MELLKRLKDANKAVFKIRLSGMITTSTTENVKKLLHQYRFHTPVALAVVINSNGGSATQCNIIRQEILSYAETKKIKVYSFVEDYATSGGYLILTSGSEIYSARGSLLGNIGANFWFFELKELAESYGIKRRQWSTSDKDLQLRLDLLNTLSPETKTWADGILKQTTQQLQELISQSRGLKLKTQEAFNGDLFNSKQATEVGLVDKIGTCNEIINSLYPKVPILELKKRNLEFIK
jgi:ClpP class serine protease